jgi:PAP2 superfamily
VIALLCFGAVFLALWGMTHRFFPPLMLSVRSGVGRLARWLRGHSRLGPLFGRLETWRSYLPLVIALAIGTIVIVWTADAFTDIAAALAALATLALAIGISRVYLGVHWTSDVGAGFAAGLLWVTATTTGYELFRQYRLGQANMAQRRATASA